MTQCVHINLCFIHAGSHPAEAPPSSKNWRHLVCCVVSGRHKQVAHVAKKVGKKLFLSNVVMLRSVEKSIACIVLDTKSSRPCSIFFRKKRVRIRVRVRIKYNELGAAVGPGLGG